MDTNQMTVTLARSRLEASIFNIFFFVQSRTNMLAKESNKEKIKLFLQDLKKRTMKIMEEMQNAVANKIIEKNDHFYLSFFILAYIDEKAILIIIGHDIPRDTWDSQIELHFKNVIYAGEKIYQLLGDCAQTSGLASCVYRLGILILSSEYRGKYSKEENKEIRDEIGGRLETTLATNLMKMKQGQKVLPVELIMKSPTYLKIDQYLALIVSIALLVVLITVLYVELKI